MKGTGGMDNLRMPSGRDRGGRDRDRDRRDSRDRGRDKRDSRERDRGSRRDDSRERR